MVNAAQAVSAAISSGVVTVTVGGMDYDVSTISGTFLDHQDVLETQVWWGQDAIVDAFVNALSFTLGAPNLAGYDGPYFAFKSGQDRFVGLKAWTKIPGSQGEVDEAFELGATTAVYAIATPAFDVPLPKRGLKMRSGVIDVNTLGRKTFRST